MGRLCAVGLLAVALAVGCGDDEGGATDASVDAQADTAADTAGDTLAGDDATTDSGTGQSCLAISLCKQDCTDPDEAIACAEACQATGCEASRAGAAALQVCTLAECETECADPSADGCMPCAQEKCSEEVIACLAAKCS